MTKVADCASWLRSILRESDERLPARVVIEAARREGFADRKTLLRGRAEAGVVSERVGFGRDGSWWWSRDPRVAASRGRRRHVQSIRPRSWQLDDDRTGDVAARCDRCRRVGIAPVERLPCCCPTSTCSGVMRRPMAEIEIVADVVQVRPEIEPAWPGTFHPCPVCLRAQAVRPDGRCVYQPGCRGVIRVALAPNTRTFHMT